MHGGLLYWQSSTAGQVTNDKLTVSTPSYPRLAVPLNLTIAYGKGMQSSFLGASYVLLNHCAHWLQQFKQTLSFA